MKTNLNPHHHSVKRINSGPLLIKGHHVVPPLAAAVVFLVLFLLPFIHVNAQNRMINDLSIQLPRAIIDSGSGSVELSHHHDEIDDRTQELIWNDIKQNQQQLIQEGTLPAVPDQDAIVAFSWPLRLKAGLTDPGFYAISNYIDRNPAYPNQIQDYNCGTRSYDVSSGYNHKGTDIFTWPFSWLKMDSSHVEVIAAASGTIVGKSDGNYDRNCAMGSGNWNAVYVQHADGSVAWYGHMKNGSLTTKAVGQTVSQGEYLGVVGSSGSSTGPHLHFEVYDANNQLVDPWNGPCNSSPSWWANQQPYYNSTLNKIMTCHKPSEFNQCPTIERPNESRSFCNSDTIYLMTFYRDVQAGQTVTHRLINPSGAIHSQWTQNMNTTYVASWWYYSTVLGSQAASGTWRYQVTYLGITHQTTFTLNSTAVPALSISVSPNNGVCSAIDIVFSANPTHAGANPTYRWEVNNAYAGSGPTYSSNTLGGGSTVRCIMTSSSACVSPKTATSNTINMVWNAPAMPGTITGPVSGVCGNTYSYSIAPVSGATQYNWTAPAGATIMSGHGTTSISVRFNSTFTTGTLGVSAFSNCGSSASRTLSVAGAPLQPGAITGPSSVCKRQLNVAYSIAAVSGATSYTWTVPSGASIVSGQGTTSIRVNFGTKTGNVTVRASNGCGASASRSLAITMPCRMSDDGMETENPIEVSVHPNPSRNQFVLKLNADPVEGLQVQIIDLLGKVVETHNGIMVGGELVFGADYVPGVYIVRIIQGEHEAHVRIIKQ